MAVSPDPLVVRPGHWQPVVVHLFERYEHVCRHHQQALEDKVGRDLAARTLGMCVHVQAHVEEFIEDKANRWLGFVQGILTVAGLLSVEDERNYTRPLFHALHGVSARQEVQINEAAP